MSALHAITLNAIDGSELPLAQFKGKPLLIVNVASQCGLTPQYATLQQLHAQYAGKGLVILGVPCNQFAGQEPGTEGEIAKFCEATYQVGFPLTSKVEVNGPGRHGLYTYLAGEGAPFPGDITWNFEKFLVNGQGDVVARFSPRTTPDDPTVIEAIEKLLG